MDKIKTDFMSFTFDIDLAENKKGISELMPLVGDQTAANGIRYCIYGEE